MTDPADGPTAPGLVIMLEHAGRTIGVLEDRVDQLTAALEQERTERHRLAALLAAARSRAEQPDTRDVDPPSPDTTDTRPHAPDPAQGPSD